MSTKRAYLGVGVLNDLLYAVNSEEEIPIWEKDKYLILSFFPELRLKFFFSIDKCKRSKYGNNILLKDSFDKN